MSGANSKPMGVIMVTRERCNVCDSFIHADFMNNSWCPNCERGLNDTQNSISFNTIEQSLRATRDAEFEFMREYI